MHVRGRKQRRKALTCFDSRGQFSECQVTKGAHVWSWRNALCLCLLAAFRLALPTLFPRPSAALKLGILYSGGCMRVKLILTLACILLSTAFASEKNSHEADRVREAGDVLKEILNIPDDIPK